MEVKHKEQQEERADRSTQRQERNQRGKINSKIRQFKDLRTLFITRSILITFVRVSFALHEH